MWYYISEAMHLYTHMVLYIHIYPYHYVTENLTDVTDGNKDINDVLVYI